MTEATENNKTHYIDRRYMNILEELALEEKITVEKKLEDVILKEAQVTQPKSLKEVDRDSYFAWWERKRRLDWIYSKLSDYALKDRLYHSEANQERLKEKISALLSDIQATSRLTQFLTDTIKFISKGKARDAVELTTSCLEHVRNGKDFVPDNHDFHVEIAADKITREDHERLRKYKESNVPALHKKIWDINHMAARTRDCLTFAGIRTIKELLCCDKPMLLGIKNFGKKSLINLEKALAIEGLYLINTNAGDRNKVELSDNEFMKWYSSNGGTLDDGSRKERKEIGDFVRRTPSD